MLHANSGGLQRGSEKRVSQKGPDSAAIDFGCFRVPSFRLCRGDGPRSVVDGVPRIEVDGRPVRARMSWGAPRGGRLRLEPNGREFVFAFTAAAGHGTMHLRFGRQPGRLALDEIEVAEVGGDGRPGAALLRSNFGGGEAEFEWLWRVWPPDRTNTLGAGEVASGLGRIGRFESHVELTGRWPLAGLPSLLGAELADPSRTPLPRAPVGQGRAGSLADRGLLPARAAWADRRGRSSRRSSGRRPWASISSASRCRGRNRGSWRIGRRWIKRAGWYLKRTGRHCSCRASRWTRPAGGLRRLLTIVWSGTAAA